MKEKFKNVLAALEDFKQGKMLVVVDDEDRENEGDLIVAAEFADAQAINFMTKQARGLVCLAMTGEQIDRLQLPLMTEKNNTPYQTAFTVSIEAAKGVTTGISAADRATTIAAAINFQAKANDVVSPGHVFPLRAKKQGVLERAGHTEAAVDLARLAKLNPAGVICEIMNEDGSMARRPQLEVFARQHDLKILSIAELKAYRLQTETWIEEVAKAKLPIKNLGEFNITVYRNLLDDSELTAIQKGEINPIEKTLVRLHSECLTGDVLGSARCDCGEQLQLALEKISQQGGVLLYLPQEGRGIGLANKVKAYALQDQGLDTVDANSKLGFADDLRNYDFAAQVLKILSMRQVKLLTNNPRKLKALENYGFSVEREVLETKPIACNGHYLKTKRERLGHFLELTG